MNEQEESNIEERDASMDNTKADHIYFVAKPLGTSYWQCTCGNFLENDSKGVDRMLKKTLAHFKKTGHALNPRGN